MVKKLPNIHKGWKTKLIPEVLFFQEGPGVRKTQFREEGVKLLNVGNINNRELDLNTTKLHISKEEAYGKYKHFLVDEGDLLIACSGIIVDNFHNKMAYAERKDLPLCMNTSTMRFKALNKNEIDLNFFKYFLQTIHFTNQLRRLITGSAQLNFGPSHIKQIECFVPPLETQRKIADILDKADELIQNDKKTLEKYDQLAQSVFLEMFGDPQSNRKNWPKKRLGDLSSDIKYGTNNKAFEFSSYNNIPVLRIPNVASGKVNLIGLKYSNFEKKEYKLLLLKKGDLLFVRTNGNPDYIGRCAVFQFNDEYLYASYLIRVRLYKNSPILPDILSFIINFPTFRARIIREARTTAGNYNLNTQGLKSYEIILSPIKLQQKFLEIINHIETQKQLARQSLQKSEELFLSLLQGAFKGELIGEKKYEINNDGLSMAAEEDILYNTK